MAGELFCCILFLLVPIWFKRLLNSICASVNGVFRHFWLSAPNGFHIEQSVELLIFWCQHFRWQRKSNFFPHRKSEYVEHKHNVLIGEWFACQIYLWSWYAKIDFDKAISWNWIITRNLIKLNQLSSFVMFQANNRWTINIVSWSLCYARYLKHHKANNKVIYEM